MASPKSSIPVLVQLAQIQKNECPLPGHYDYSHHLWVSQNGEPLILAEAELAELRTKTQTQREQDD